MKQPDDFYRLIDTGRIENHIRTLEGVRHPRVAPVALERAADYIAATLNRAGCEMSEHIFHEEGHPFRNIIGTLPGKGQKDERYILMAHYDTTAEAPGADDNASGVAVMLELAAILARAGFERTIQFVGVALEENAVAEQHNSGTRGSRALAREARASHWPIQEVIVLESVAYAGEDVVQTAPAGLPFPVPEAGNFIAMVGNEHSGAMVENLATLIASHRFDLPFLPVTVPGNGEVLPDSRRSDHAPFWDEGYRAVMLTDTTNFRNPHYHCASDTLDTLNLDFAARVGALTGAYLAGACGLLDGQQ